MNNLLKPVIRYDRLTGDKLRYPSVTEASKSSGFSASSVSNNCRKRIRRLGHYVFRYETTVEEVPDFVQSQSNESWQPIEDCEYKVSTVASTNLNDYPRYKIRGKRRSTHRLVAQAFLQDTKTENTQVVHHLDNNKQNPTVNNLQWVSQSDNVKYAHKDLKCNSGRQVIQLDITNNRELAKFSSIAEASRQTGINAGTISSVCNGRYDTAGGYYWKFVTAKLIAIDQPGELWKPFPDAPEYLISNQGRTKKNNSIIRQSTWNGYKRVTIRNVKYRVHRLVALTWLPRPTGDITKYVPDHLNMIRDDNRVENLEWVTIRENVERSCGIPIVQCDPLTLNVISKFPSISAAARFLNKDPSSLKYYIKTQKEMGGSIWKYGDAKNGSNESIKKIVTVI